MNEKPIFTQTIRCDDCDESLFEIAEMYKEDVCIRCHECGAQFTIFVEKGGEAISRTLSEEQKRQDHISLSELLEIRLHAFEEQAGGYGPAAALLFENYIETLFDAVIESVDDAILKRLQVAFFHKIKDKGMSEGPALLLDIESAAVETLEHSGYELQIDGETETED